jgi:hypothetical protein
MELSSTAWILRLSISRVSAKGRIKVTKIRDGTEVAARYFVYKLYDTTGGQPMQWGVLLGMGESAATISRAVERG